MARNRFWLVLCGVSALCLAPTLAQDNIEGPYGAVNGDLFGRARTATPMGDWSQGMEVAWEIDVRAQGYDRVQGRTHPVFDADGNLYWLTSIGSATGGYQYVASAAPNGTLRWKSADWLNGVSGTLGNGGVVVGGAAVYAFCGGAAFDYDGDGVPGWAAGAYDKATGARIWRTDLDGDWDNNGVAEDAIDAKGGTHPVLHNGKLYIVTNGALGVAVTQLNAATGAKLFYNIVDPAGAGSDGQIAGTVNFVAGVFNGQDGLFFNNGHWNPPHDVWGVKLTPTGAVMAWKSLGGKNAGRSHLVYSPVTGHLYAHTWWDDNYWGSSEGDSFGVYNAQTGEILAAARNGNYGYYDVACLGWDDISVVVGAFNGGCQIYGVNGAGQIGPVKIFAGDSNWREMRWFGQLLRDDPNDPNGFLLTSTWDGFGEFGPGYEAKIVLLELGKALPLQVYEDGPMYVDQIEVLDGPDFNNLTLRHTEDFEEAHWQVGPLAGQDPDWYDGGSVGANVPEIADDPTSSGYGRVLKLDAPGEDGFPAAKWYFEEVGLWNQMNVAVIRFKQWRADLLDEQWIEPGDLPYGNSEDADGYLYPVGVGVTNPRAPLTAGRWQTVELWIDQVGLTYEATIDGQKDPNRPPGAIPALSAINAMYWDLTGTPWIPPLMPAHAQWSLPGGNDARSPVLGPDGKIYFFLSSNGKLIALKRTAPAACPGDCNCDDNVDFGDINPFVAVFGGANPCSFENCDINGDGNIDFGDINPFVAILTAGGGPCP